MTASAVGPVKAMTLRLDAGKAAAYLDRLLAEMAGGATLRPALKAFAHDQDVPL
jgi:phosphotransferase system enzyme I (PtsP)